MSAHSFLSLLGPTSVGKTAFAQALAQEFVKNGREVVMISADSRQVYRGLEIGSGVDVPPPHPGIQWYGTSIIRPDEEWSLGHFWRYARPLIAAAAEAGRVVIVVGGTGLYHQELWKDQIMEMTGVNPAVRSAAAKQTLPELQTWARQVDPTGFASLNRDDSLNPRRLIRVIERAVSRTTRLDNSGNLSIAAEASVPSVELPHLTVSLTAPLSWLEPRITRRVHERVSAGMCREVVELLARYPDQTLPAWSATGYREIAAHVLGKSSLEDAMALWIRAERAYAKRQLTWLKKSAVNFAFDVSHHDWQQKAMAKTLTQFV